MRFGTDRQRAPRQPPEYGPPEQQFQTEDNQRQPGKRYVSLVQAAVRLHVHLRLLEFVYILIDSRQLRLALRPIEFTIC